MSDLIDRQDVLDAVNDCGICIQRILDIPSAEPERKKGTWIKVGHWGRSYKCNQCGNFLDFYGVNVGRGDANFCPNCGADMRGE